MASTAMSVSIGGLPLSPGDLAELLDVQLEEASTEADAATLSARLTPTAPGGWASVLDALAQPRTPLTVELTRGFDSYRFEGASTEAEWEIAPDGASRLTVKALDRTQELDAEEKVVAWRGTSDSGIAETIFASYGIVPDTTPTPAGPDPDVHVVLQRATDWAFLRSLAAKWGYEVYLEAATGRVVGHFGPLEPTAAEQAELVFGFGGDSPRITAGARLIAGKKVTAARLQPLTDAVVQGADDGTGEAQGPTSLGGQSRILLSPDDVDGEIDPARASASVARRSAFAVTLGAEVDAGAIDRLLRARRTVAVKGVGGVLSGTYLADRVRHRVTGDRHTQQLTLVRNALGAAGGLGALAGALP
jgi:phage protein D